jgi:2'-5' RNA ligase
VPPDNFHVTLAFLGNQPAELFDDIVVAGAAVPARPLELVLDRFGYFARPRVFWLGASGATAELARLSAEIWDRIEPLGIVRDTRAFKAHLTLARKVARLPEVPTPAPVVWRVADFSLVESVTAQEGARYRVASTFPH